MYVHILDSNPSILNTFLTEIRDRNIQTDSMRFRRNIERIGEILAYEISKELTYNASVVKTPLGEKSINNLSDNIVLCSILRAGLPLHQGLLNYFDGAENAFISAYRKHSDPFNFEIEVEYLAGPSLEDKVLVLADPMLATGKSIVSVYEGLQKLGVPNEIHLACVIGSTTGIDFIKDHFPSKTQLWIATVDDHLNAKDYIVPGLGDAGDLAFGQKL
jgi:uracil phosphoribosyltransferase